MRAFISYHPGDIEEMHSKLEMVEAVADGAEMLKLAKGEKGVIRAEADQLKEEKEALEAK